MDTTDVTDLAAAVAVLIARRGEVVLDAAKVEQARQRLLTGQLILRTANLGDGTVSFWTEDVL